MSSNAPYDGLRCAMMASMRLRDAIEMLADSDVEGLGPTTSANLGAGDGAFTLALAEVLASGSVNHARGFRRLGLRRMLGAQRCAITVHPGESMKQPWPLADLDGILMANSLHYVEDKPAFIRACRSYDEIAAKLPRRRIRRERRQSMGPVSCEPGQTDDPVRTRRVHVG